MLCYEGSCQDLVCLPGARYCEDGSAFQCSFDGLSTTLLDTCLSGEYCSDELGACVAQVCVPNEPWCNVRRAEVCDDIGSGSIEAGTDCALADGLQCVAGECRCVSGLGDCDDDPSNGCETATSNDPDACGGCDVVCSNSHVATRSCVEGVCGGSCETGYADCNTDMLSDGCEVNVFEDPENCSSCDIACSPLNLEAARCTNAMCDGPCAEGYDDCNSDRRTDGCEVRTASDPNNCGSCRAVCPSDGLEARSCVDGVCSGTCAEGFMDCNQDQLADGCEVYTDTDPLHCGDCETVCDESESCVAGTCTPAPPEP